VTIGVTVTGMAREGPSRRNPLDMGTVRTVTLMTMNYRGSLKGGTPLYLETRGSVMG
jgi:hypothetical protein